MKSLSFSSVFFLLLAGILLFACTSERSTEAFDVLIRVDVSEKMGEVNHIWRFFGADEPNYAYMKNGRKLLRDLGSLGKQQVFFRAHNMLNTGEGTHALKWGSTNAYTEDENGNPIYDWKLPAARVGGPNYAGVRWDYLPRFLEHCIDGTNYATGEKGSPLDFVAFHAKGQPVFDSGYVQMNMAKQLTAIETSFKIVAAYPETRNLPIVIGESDPEGCAACQGDHLGYRNGTMYSSYTAASFVRKLDLADKYGVKFEGALTWAFEFEDQPFFAGFRAISTNGINKPVFNVFKMFSMMEGERVAVESDHAVPLADITVNSVRKDPDVSAYASFDGEKLYLMAWHYHDNDLQGKSADICFVLDNLPVEKGRAEVSCFLVDKQQSNSYTTWLAMGSPAIGQIWISGCKDREWCCLLLIYKLKK
jgi:hypothetical protein